MLKLQELLKRVGGFSLYLPSPEHPELIKSDETPLAQIFMTFVDTWSDCALNAKYHFTGN